MSGKLVFKLEMSKEEFKKLIDIADNYISENSSQSNGYNRGVCDALIVAEAKLFKFYNYITSSHYTDYRDSEVLFSRLFSPGHDMFGHYWLDEGDIKDHYNRNATERRFFLRMFEQFVLVNELHE